MPTNCQTEISATVIRRRFPGRARARKVGQADGLQETLGDAPERGQDQLPDETDDHHREHGRQENEGAIDARRAAALGSAARPAAVPIGFCTSIWMAKKTKLLRSAFQKAVDPVLVGQQRREVLEAREARRAASSLA